MNSLVILLNFLLLWRALHSTVIMWVGKIININLMNVGEWEVAVNE